MKIIERNKDNHADYYTRVYLYEFNHKYIYRFFFFSYSLAVHDICWWTWLLVCRCRSYCFEYVNLSCFYHIMCSSKIFVTHVNYTALDQYSERQTMVMKMTNKRHNATPRWIITAKRHTHKSQQDNISIFTCYKLSFRMHPSNFNKLTLHLETICIRSKFSEINWQSLHATNHLLPPPKKL